MSIKVVWTDRWMSINWQFNIWAYRYRSSHNTVPAILTDLHLCIRYITYLSTPSWLLNERSTGRPERVWPALVTKIFIDCGYQTFPLLYWDRTDSLSGISHVRYGFYPTYIWTQYVHIAILPYSKNIIFYFRSRGQIVHAPMGLYRNTCASACQVCLSR